MHLLNILNVFNATIRKKSKQSIFSNTKRSLSARLVSFSKIYVNQVILESRLFYSHGKLLISGEYLVLDGALALAVPVKLGQSLLIEECDTPGLHWIADQRGGTWFEAFFDLPGLEIKHSTDAGIASDLRKLLESAQNMQQGFLSPGRKLPGKHFPGIQPVLGTWQQFYTNN